MMVDVVLVVVHHVIHKHNIPEDPHRTDMDILVVQVIQTDMTAMQPSLQVEAVEPAKWVKKLVQMLMVMVAMGRASKRRRPMGSPVSSQ